jgi:hypothetical protein
MDKRFRPHSLSDNKDRARFAFFETKCEKKVLSVFFKKRKPPKSLLRNNENETKTVAKVYEKTGRAFTLGA